MAGEKGYLLDATPGSVDEKALNPGTFPTEAWSFTKPGDANPTLTLKDAWTLAVAGDQTVAGGLGVTGAASVGSLVSSGAVSGTTGDFSGDLSTDADLHVTGTPYHGSAQILSWYDVTDPTVGWFASKTAGWTGDSFSAGWELDFSSVVTAGTKAVQVVFSHTVSGGITYWRKYGDTNISNTPNAATEYSHILHRPQSTAYYAVVVLWLSADYKAQIAVTDTAQDIYCSYPTAELR